MNNNELECEACRENKVQQLFGDMCAYCNAHLCQECKEYQVNEMPNCIKCADDDLVEPHQKIKEITNMKENRLENEKTFVEIFNEATLANHSFGGYPNEQYRHYLRHGSTYMADKWGSETLLDSDGKLGNETVLRGVDVWARMLEIVDRMDYEDKAELRNIRIQLKMRRQRNNRLKSGYESGNYKGD